MSSYRAWCPSYRAWCPPTGCLPTGYDVFLQGMMSPYRVWCPPTGWGCLPTGRDVPLRGVMSLYGAWCPPTGRDVPLRGVMSSYGAWCPPTGCGVLLQGVMSSRPTGYGVLLQGVMPSYGARCPPTGRGVPLWGVVSPYGAWCPLRGVVSSYRVWCPHALQDMVSSYRVRCPPTGRGVVLRGVMSSYKALVAWSRLFFQVDGCNTSANESRYITFELHHTNAFSLKSILLLTCTPHSLYFPLLEHVFASLPQMERGVAKVLGGDPKGNNFLYTNGKTVVIRNIDVNSVVCLAWPAHFCFSSVFTPTDVSCLSSSTESIHSRHLHRASTSSHCGQVRTQWLLHRLWR